MPSSEDRLLHLLKARGPLQTQAIARQLGITVPGARKHLSSLHDRGMVGYRDEAGAVGRPKRIWHLSSKAESRFPDSHAFLTLEMIGAIRRVYGERGLDRLIAEREGQTRERYEAALAGLCDLKHKVARLAELRSQEGYMAEWRALPGGDFILSENHCPICAAARICQGFCRSELQIFSAVLGADASIERSEHILAGARRCAYRISPAGTHS